MSRTQSARFRPQAFFLLCGSLEGIWFFTVVRLEVDFFFLNLSYFALENCWPAVLWLCLLLESPWVRDSCLCVLSGTERPSVSRAFCRSVTNVPWFVSVFIVFEVLFFPSSTDVLNLVNSNLFPGCCFVNKNLPPISRTGHCGLPRADVLGPVGAASRELLCLEALGGGGESVAVEVRTGDSLWHTAPFSMATMKFNIWTDCFPSLPIRMHNFHIFRRISTNSSKLCPVKEGNR